MNLETKIKNIIPCIKNDNFFKKIYIFIKQIFFSLNKSYKKSYSQGSNGSNIK